MAVSSVKTIDQLLAALDSPSYKGRSEDEVRSIAENLFRNQRDSATLQAQQSYNENAAALDAQRAGINTNYDRQLREQQQALDRSVAAQDRSQIGRGMQRSSYNAATLANMRTKGNEALADIEQNRTNALGSLDSQKTQLQRQLQQNLGAAESAYQSSVASKMQELMDQDYTRRQQAIGDNNSLMIQLYNLMKESGGGGSGGGSGSGGQASENSATVPASQRGGDVNLLASLLGDDDPTKKDKKTVKAVPGINAGGSQTWQNVAMVR